MNNEKANNYFNTNTHSPYQIQFNKKNNMDTEAANTTAATDLKSGPFAVLYNAVRGNTQILVNVRNNHKILGRVKAYDRHMNL